MNYSYDPFVGWKIDKFKSDFINIDQNGKRIVNLKYNDKFNTIHFFGGSSIWGVGSSDSDSIPSIIGEKLKIQYQDACFPRLCGQTKRKSFNKFN